MSDTGQPAPRSTSTAARALGRLLPGASRPTTVTSPTTPTNTAVTGSKRPASETNDSPVHKRVATAVLKDSSSISSSALARHVNNASPDASTDASPDTGLMDLDGPDLADRVEMEGRFNEFHALVRLVGQAYTEKVGAHRNLWTDALRSDVAALAALLHADHPVPTHPPAQATTDTRSADASVHAVIADLKQTLEHFVSRLPGSAPSTHAPRDAPFPVGRTSHDPSSSKRTYAMAAKMSSPSDASANKRARNDRRSQPNPPACLVVDVRHCVLKADASAKSAAELVNAMNTAITTVTPAGSPTVQIAGINRGKTGNFKVFPLSPATPDDLRVHLGAIKKVLVKYGSGPVEAYTDTPWSSVIIHNADTKSPDNSPIPAEHFIDQYVRSNPSLSAKHSTSIRSARWLSTGNALSKPRSSVVLSFDSPEPVEEILRQGGIFSDGRFLKAARYKKTPPKSRIRPTTASAAPPTVAASA